MTIPYVRWAGLTFDLPQTSLPPRRLYDHEINYVLSGAGTCCFGGREHAAPTDACFFVQPRVTHSWSNTGEVAWVTLGVHFDWQHAPDAEKFSSFRADDGRKPTDETLFRTPQEISGWDHRAHPILDLQGRFLVRHFLEEVVDAFARDDEYSREQAGALLAAAILQIQREARLLGDGGTSRVGPDAQRRLASARRFLEAVTPHMPSVAEVAARVGWSADYLAVMARSAWGISPRRVQIAARLRHARQLLREGTPVGVVARQCGFADTSHLARAFRKDSGLSPREYSALSRQRK